MTTTANINTDNLLVATGLHKRYRMGSEDLHVLRGVDTTVKRGQWLCMKYEIREMVKNKAGSIVNVSSILGRVGFMDAPAYTAAKHGLIGLTKAAALDYAGQGIRINAVCPGFIVTPMLERAGITSDAETRRQVTALHPVGRMGEAREVAEAIVWLASDEASFVTADSLMVDGGYIAQ